MIDHAFSKAVVGEIFFAPHKTERLCWDVVLPNPCLSAEGAIASQGGGEVRTRPGLWRAVACRSQINKALERHSSAMASSMTCCKHVYPPLRAALDGADAAD